MIKWNEVTWYSKLAAVIFFIGVLPSLTFYIGRQYQIANDSYAQEEEIDSHGIVAPKDLDIQGIGPYSLASAPVPVLALSADDVPTVIPLKDEEGTVVRFEDGMSHANNFFTTLAILGYARMGGIPTAVTLISQNTGGTGYFPSLVLYQAKEGEPAISQVIPIEGDRIDLQSVSIQDDAISLSFVSKGYQYRMKVQYHFIGGKLVKME